MGYHLRMHNDVRGWLAAIRESEPEVDAFRTRKETIKAAYTADEAVRRIRTALAGIGEVDSELEGTDAGPEASATVVLVARVEDPGGSPEGYQEVMRMNVRPGRVSAIERAEPGATEVRTLAAYVQALGGRLEIVAGIGGERIMLR